MDKTSELCGIITVDRGRKENRLDELICEKNVTLILNREKFCSAVITGGNERLWAIGHLRARGLIKSARDVSSVVISGNTIYAEADIQTAKHSVFMPCEWQIRLGVLMDAIKGLADAPLFRRTGCVHAARIISGEGAEIFTAEDISRHSAVDKAIGYIVENGAAPRNTALVFSGRMPLDMTEKAVNAEIPLMASISAPTAEGVACAKAHNMTMVGFVRGERCNIYCAPERIIY